MSFSKIFQTFMSAIFILLFAKFGLADPKGGPRGGSTKGTLDGGGANGLNFKLIESYKINEKDLPQENYIKPFLDFLTQSNLRDISFTDSDPSAEYYYGYSMESYRLFIINFLKSKPVYNLPVEMEDIGSSLHGIPFTTSQFAVQTASDVFLPQKIYNELIQKDSLEAEKNILHEIFMGMKILMKMDKYTQCRYTTSNPNSVYRSNNCDGESHDFDGSFFITPMEHAQVRALTNLVVEKSRDFKDPNKRSELVYIFINALFENKMQNSFLRVYRSGTEVIKAVDLIKIIKGVELINTNTLFCNHWKDLSEDQLKNLKEDFDKAPIGKTFSFRSKFKVKLVTVENGNNMQIKLIDEKGKMIPNSVVELNESIRGYRTSKINDKNILSRDNQLVDFLLIENRGGRKLGDKFLGIDLVLNKESSEISSYRVYESVTYRAEDKRTISKQNDIYNCTDEETITLTKQ